MGSRGRGTAAAAVADVTVPKVAITPAAGVAEAKPVVDVTVPEAAEALARDSVVRGSVASDSAVAGRCRTQGPLQSPRLPPRLLPSSLLRSHPKETLASLRKRDPMPGPLA